MKISVKVKPGVKEAYIKELEEGQFEVAVKEPPVQGKANRAVIACIADYFRVPQSGVRIVSGFTSRQKIIEVAKG